ncbi:MAG: hypothetical protein A2W22_01730 [Candidatus Levybacteria bacterium RBG_16_35_11]|nr:MAG: hypothetical protein A2W22_01730 [Candidatus Levybacteria bacterium RBG_16_35_11]
MNEFEGCQSERHEHLHKTYEILVQLLMHEGRFISERTNHFLVFNSFLFATLLLLPNQVGWIYALRVTIPIFGFLMSVLHSIIISRTMNAADFWRSSIGLIEKDSDFWYLDKVDGDIRDTDLDIFTARSRYLNGNTFSLKSPIILSRPPSFINKLSSQIPDPNQIYVFLLPSFIAILWILALIWGLSDLSQIFRQ